MQVKPSQIAARGPRYPPPRILPVAKEDVDAIATMSFSSTPWSPMGVAFHPTPADRAKAINRLRDSLLKALDDPDRNTLLKGLDPETGELASYAVWTHVRPPAALEEGRKTGKDQPSAKEEGEDSSDPSSRLNAYIGDEIKRFRDEWADGVEFVELEGLATATRFQRRGYATALLEEGHRRADVEGCVSFLVSSPMARSLYASLRWHEVGQIVVDMRKWAPGAEAGDRGWGLWKLYHMIRLPKTVKK